MNLKKTPLYAESWNVAFRKKCTGSIITDYNTRFQIIKNNFRYWAADPFVVENDDKLYIFAELYDYILRRGILGYCVINDRKISKWKPIIKEKYHLSYPCIIKDNNKWYIMPESGQANELSIYEAVDFPDQWNKKQVIRQNVKYADTTPLPGKENKQALTHCVDDPENPQLLLIDLKNNLKDIVVNAEPFHSRPAGHLFMIDDMLIRPAQLSDDCGEGYGKGLIFLQCQIDDNNNYNETEIKTIKPKDLKFDRQIYLDGMHTYNASEHYEVIDIKTRRFNLLNLFMRLINKIL